MIGCGLFLISNSKICCFLLFLVTLTKMEWKNDIETKRQAIKTRLYRNLQLSLWSQENFPRKNRCLTNRSPYSFFPFFFLCVCVCVRKLLLFRTCSNCFFCQRSSMRFLLGGVSKPALYRVFSDCFFCQRPCERLFFHLYLFYFVFFILFYSINYYYRGGARGVMVIVVGNWHSDSSSNTVREWLHFT